jgi:hypothetical protein
MLDLTVIFVLVLRLVGLSELNALLLVAWLSKFSPSQRARPGISLANRVRSDGGGTQVLYAAVTLAVAARIGLDYHHRRFVAMEHFQGDPAEFVNAWNQAFDFDQPYGIPPDRRVFSLSSRQEVLKAILAYKSGFALTSDRFKAVIDRHPEWLGAVRPALRAIYTPERIESVEESNTVVFHARRGDVSSDVNSSRWTGGE